MNHFLLSCLPIVFLVQNGTSACYAVCKGTALLVGTKKIIMSKRTFVLLKLS